MWRSRIWASLRKLNLRHLVALVVLFVGTIGALLSAVSYFLPPEVFVASAKTPLSVSEPLVIKFSYPPARRSVLATLQPEIDGSWQWHGGIGGALADELVFQPDTTWPPTAQYQVSIENVEGALGSSTATDISVNFQTSQLPTVAQVTELDCTSDQSCQKKPLETATAVKTTSKIELGLDQAQNNSAEFFFSFEPSVEFDTEVSVDTQSYILTPRSKLSQGQLYTLRAEREALVYSQSGETIIKRGEREKVWETTFTTVAPALITNFSPQGSGVLPIQKTLTATFSEPMITDDNLQSIQISPAVSGSWQWSSDTELTFTSTESLAVSTVYTVTIPSGIATKSGGFLAESSAFSFTTIGQVKVTSFSPGSGAAVTSAILVAFDQPVDKLSAESKFSLSPSVDGQFSWRGNTMVFQPTKSLEQYLSYKITIGKNVVSVYGQSNALDISHSFTTEEKVVILNVQYDRQDRALSCEAAALKMALVYKGVGVSENDIMALVGYDPTTRNGDIWGDPDVAFVGNINGSQNTTGYGVHWDPIARAARAYRQAEAFTGWSLTQLATAIDQGNPVVVWGTTGKVSRDTWFTSAGKKVETFKGEHARTVIGYKGRPDNVTSIILADPLAGKITWSAAAFKGNWAQFNNAGVVVY